MKIYTKTGDKGKTALFGGKRVEKDDIRIEAYGTVDELNSNIGLLHSFVNSEEIKNELLYIQSRLFDCGAILATDPDKNLIASKISSEDYELLENAMDRMNTELPELRAFILPSGSKEIAIAHICTSVCRRAERRVVTFVNAVKGIAANVVIYLNRLSDYFFVVARFVGKELGAEEVVWTAR